MKVLFYGSVQENTCDEKELEVGNVLCVRALIDLLGERFGEHFKEFLLADNTCFFLVNGNGIMTTGGLDTPLQSDDTVEVLPFVEGG
jgi:molybdopterin converting factor small subunit